MFQSQRSIYLQQGETSPIHEAIEQNNISLLEEVLNSGKFNASNTFIVSGTRKLDPPIVLACARGNCAIVDLLMQKGHACLNSQAYDTLYNPLQAACHHGHVDIVKLLVEKYHASINANRLMGTPLFLAAQSGHVAVIEVLLQHGANSNVGIMSGETPLIVACHYGFADAASTLIHCGHAEVNATDAQKRTPLSIAARFEHLNVVKVILDAGGSSVYSLQSALGEAIVNANIENDSKSTGV